MNGTVRTEPLLRDDQVLRHTGQVQKAPEVFHTCRPGHLAASASLVLRHRNPLGQNQLY